MKLISMTSFVLEQNKILETYINHLIRPLFERCVNYAEFLKQPLKLGMFVPCDENGNILKDPNSIISTLEKGEIFNREVLETWEKAKEKVLFVFKPHFDISAIKHHILQDRNIEYLADFGELELTENAIKQIGL